MCKHLLTTTTQSLNMFGLLYNAHLYKIYKKGFLAIAPSVHVFAVTHPNTPS